MCVSDEGQAQQKAPAERRASADCCASRRGGSSRSARQLVKGDSRAGCAQRNATFTRGPVAAWEILASVSEAAFLISYATSQPFLRTLTNYVCLQNGVRTELCMCAKWRAYRFIKKMIDNVLE